MPVSKGNIPWNAGTSKGWVDSRGYRWLYVNENGRRIARRESRVIIEHQIGRRLDPWELVHHKDGNKTNNEIDNLELQSFADHTAMHSAGRRQKQDSRRTMEAFALMREELKRERALKADLLAAVLHALSMSETTWTAYDEGIMRAAIAKATGEEA